MFEKILAKKALVAGLLPAVAGCGGTPVDFENPPLGADGKSRWLFMQVITPDVFVGELYARKAGAGSWGADLVSVDNIYPGDRKAYNLDDGSGNCNFDLRRRVFGGDGPPEYQDQLNVDLCAMNTKKQAWLL